MGDPRRRVDTRRCMTGLDAATTTAAARRIVRRRGRQRWVDSSSSPAGRPALGPADEGRQRVAQLVERQFDRRPVGPDDPSTRRHVARLQQGAQTSPQTIALHGRADRAGDGEGHARLAQRGVVPVRAPQWIVADTDAVTSEIGELVTSAESADQADRRARPLARRERSTARPPRVLMRARKPCLRARRRLLGWNVRFTRISGLMQWTGRDDEPARSDGAGAGGRVDSNDCRAAVRWCATDKPPGDPPDSTAQARPGCSTLPTIDGKPHRCKLPTGCGRPGEYAPEERPDRRPPSSARSSATGSATSFRVRRELLTSAAHVRRPRCPHCVDKGVDEGARRRRGCW